MKLTSNQISPNLRSWDVLKPLFTKYKNLDSFFEQKFCTKNYLLANSARTCLGIIADIVNPEKTKKIGLPAFICAVVATPFLERGYSIEWIDTDENGLMSVKDFKEKSNKISLLVVPHIFGQEAPLQEIMSIAKKQNIFVVEDGAHLIRQFDVSRFEQIADAQILSFGREKVVSCVSGGALVWPNESSFSEKFSKVILAKSQKFWIFKHMMQPIIFSLSLPWWNNGGKIIPWFFQKIKFLPLAVTSTEKQGKEDFPQASLSSWQRKILAHQLQEYEKKQFHAQSLSLTWEKTLKRLFPQSRIILPKNAFRVILKNISKEQKAKLLQLKLFHLNEWDGFPISPPGINFEAFKYHSGKCKKAENFAQTYITLPTNIRTTKHDIKAFAKTCEGI